MEKNEFLLKRNISGVLLDNFKVFLQRILLFFLIFYPLISKTFNRSSLKYNWFFRYSVLVKLNQLQILHLTVCKWNPFKKVDFWLTVRMRMCNYGKLDHTQTTYLRFSISLHIDKTNPAGTSECILNYIQSP